MDLDPFQLRVVESRARTIRVVAPAGSGKTRTIVARVRARIGEGVPAERILLLTFDRAAAGSLRGSLDRDPGGPRVSTLNAFGNALLRERVPEEHAPVLSRRKRGEILDGVLGGSVAEPLRGADAPTAAWLALFARMKNEGFLPADRPGPALAEFLDGDDLGSTFLPREPERRKVDMVVAVARVYRGYDRALREAGGMDFDDQKLRAWIALERRSRLRAEVQGEWSEVVVDEFQDVNRLDFELVRLLAARATLVVAGDDDQAIYAFRGCSHEFLVGLQSRLGRAVESHPLRTNYRSPPNLLAAADRLIRKNRRRIPKRPIAHRRDPATLTVSATPDPDREAEAVAESIARSGRPYTDFAILYRLHVQSLPFQLALLARAIPFTVRREDDLTSEDGLERMRAMGADSELLSRLSAARESRQDADAEAGVSLRTVFRSKGLQWPVVHVVGCNEDVMPHRRSGVEEERRLFYVAMTRASQELHLWWIDSIRTTRASRFLRESGLGGPFGWRLRRGASRRAKRMDRS